jgi:hypothetical protein
MSGETPNYGNKGKTFGKIVFAILTLIVLCIYLYHHPSNAAPVLK